MKLIGGGEHSTLFRLENGHILKAITKLESCNQAGKEFTKQRRIYDCFNRLASRDHGKHRLLNQIKEYVIISEPMTHQNEPIVINNKQYACSLEMSALKGLPMEMIQSVDNKLDRYYTATYWNQTKLNNDEIMLHLSFNNHEKSRLFGVNINELVSENNPSRGYFFNRHDAEEWIESLRMDYNFPLHINDLEEMVGFIYGWIFYACQIIPLDVEMTLGFYDGKFKLNVLDFDRTFDMRELSNNTKNMDNEIYYQFLDEKEKLFQRIKQAINHDEYIDLDRDRVGLRGFNTAKDEYTRYTTLSCTLCGKDAHTMDYVSGKFYCRSCQK